jgi:hypothetical protein
MPTLQWVGKGKVVNHHLDVPFRVLNSTRARPMLGMLGQDPSRPCGKLARFV